MDALAGLRTKQALMRKVIQASLVGIAALSVNAVADELKQLPRWDTAARYTIDSARTVVSFEVRSFGVLRHLGRFRKSFGSVSLDPQAHEAAGKSELIVAGRMGDEFLIDEDAQVLYLATHRQNTIDRVSMEPARNSGFTQSIAGDPFTENLIGPTSGTWGRGAGEYGRVA
jgi:hypothetical protein